MTIVTNNLAAGRLQRLAEPLRMFYDSVQGIEQLQPINFKHELNTLLSPPQSPDWNEYVRKKLLFQFEWELMNELGCIENYPTLIDETRLKILDRIDDIERVSVSKQNHECSIESQKLIYFVQFSHLSWKL